MLFIGKYIELNLQQTVELANDSSLAASGKKQLYGELLGIQNIQSEPVAVALLYMTPIRYNRNYTSRYDSEQNIDIYRRQQSLYSYGNLAIQQNLDLTGGTFFIDSELGYIRNFGEQTYSQFTSVPIRVGYRQDLIGYNP